MKLSQIIQIKASDIPAVSRPQDFFILLFTLILQSLHPALENRTTRLSKSEELRIAVVEDAGKSCVEKISDI